MSDAPMPPLWPDDGSGHPPPPRLPTRPPTDWPAMPPASAPVPPPPPPGSRRGLLIGAIAGVVVLVLLVATMAWVFHEDPKPKVQTARPRPTTTTTEPSTTSDAGSSDSSSSTSVDSAAFAQTISDIKAFVEKERGLTFLSDVPIQLADDKDFTDQLLADFDKDKTSVQELGQVLLALGLVSTTDDVVKEERELAAAGVVGFYDPDAKRLVVRGTDTTPYVRQVLAHELTHALEDQHFNLNRPDLDKADDETSFAFSTLAEGSARRVEDAYVATMTSDDQQAALEEQAALVAQSPQIFRLPPVLLSLIQAPYDVGKQFVTRLVDEGGNARIDQAYASPPITSEQVYEPDVYLQGQGPVALPDPAPDGGASAANRGVLGVALLQQLFDPTGTAGTSLDPSLEHWGGDKYVTWTDGAKTCIKDVIVGDDPSSTGKLFDALNDWAAGPGVAATITRDGNDPAAPFALTSCS